MDRSRRRSPPNRDLAKCQSSGVGSPSLSRCIGTWKRHLTTFGQQSHKEKDHSEYWLMGLIDLYMQWMRKKINRRKRKKKDHGLDKRPGGRPAEAPLPCRLPRKRKKNRQSFWPHTRRLRVPDLSLKAGEPASRPTRRPAAVGWPLFAVPSILSLASRPAELLSPWHPVAPSISWGRGARGAGGSG